MIRKQRTNNNTGEGEIADDKFNKMRRQLLKKSHDYSTLDYNINLFSIKKSVWADINQHIPGTFPFLHQRKVSQKNNHNPFFGFEVSTINRQSWC